MVNVHIDPSFEVRNDGVLRRSPEELADLLIEFKPRFIHHPESIAHVRRITSALGAAPEATYADVPKLRTAFPAGGLATGIAYAFQPHRDTWYAAPPQQINWWMPVWPVAENNVMGVLPALVRHRYRELQR